MIHLTGLSLFRFANALCLAVLLCGGPASIAYASDWLEPGVYQTADSNQTGEVHAFGAAPDLGDLRAENSDALQNYFINSLTSHVFFFFMY